MTTEAGYFAIRESRDVVSEDDFLKAIVKIRKDEDQYGKEYVSMFG